MKRLLALAICASMLASPALAQYYGGPGGGGYGGGRGGYDDEDDRPRRRGPRYDEDRGYGRDGGGYGGQRGRASVCITSRGSCGTSPAPRGYPCRCDIPGFGMKRGNVQ